MGAGAAVVAVLVAAATAAWGIGYGGADARPATAADGGCDPTHPLDLVATPEIAAVVTHVARAAGTGTQCLAVRVTSRSAAEVAASLLGTGDRPDVWIPDSSYWTQRPTAPGHGVPTTNVSLASSPVVVAVGNARAATLARESGGSSGSGRTLSYSDLLPAPGAAVLPVRLDLPDPAASAATVSAVLGLQAALGGRRDAPAVLATVLRGAAVSRAGQAAPATVASLAPDPAGAAVPVPEQQVWSYEHGSPKAAVTAVYPPAVAGTSFDYPYVVLATGSAQRTAADRLLSALTGSVGRQLLDAAGFRAPDGTPGPELAATPGLVARAEAVSTSAAEPQSIAKALAALADITRGSRLLVVLDVSGSMAQPVPGGGGATRLGLAVQAATTGLALYPDDTVAGLWEFSTNLDGTRAYRELVPPTTLGRNPDGALGRELLAAALGQVRVQPHGDTGLNATTIAAVRRLQQGWDPSRVNSVVILTDGANDDPKGPTLAQTLKSLAAQRIPGRPVYVITIGYGPDVDTRALAALSHATGAETYRAADPRDIREVMLQAIGRRPDRPS